MKDVLGEILLKAKADYPLEQMTIMMGPMDQWDER